MIKVIERKHSIQVVGSRADWPFIKWCLEEGMMCYMETDPRATTSPDGGEGIRSVHGSVTASPALLHNSQEDKSWEKTMPYAQYVNRHLTGGAIEHKSWCQSSCHRRQNKEAWAKVSETLPDDAFADDVDDSDTVPYRKGFSSR